MCPEHGYVGGIKVFFTTETPGEVDTWVGGGVKFRTIRIRIDTLNPSRPGKQQRP